VLKLLLTMLIAVVPQVARAVELHVPAQFPTVTAALDAAQPGDEIVLAAGVFPLSTVRDGISLTIRGAGMTASVLDGLGTDVLVLTNSSVTLTDLTVRDGSDGINAEDSDVTLRRVRVELCADGIDLEDGGVLRARDSEFVWNSDDGIDLDGDSSLLCRNCIISDNGDDGIEIRMHEFTGAAVSAEVDGGRIERNEESGIQLIDGDLPTARSFYFHDVVIADNLLGGVTWQCCMDTEEIIDGHPGDEPVLIERTTIVGNGGAGVEGGAPGLMEIRDSILWQNDVDLFQVGGPLGANLIGTDPLFSTDFRLSPASPARGIGESRADVGAFPYRECSDGADNDGDGFVDLDDAQCTNLDGFTERPVSSLRCGLGPELVVLLGLFGTVRRIGRHRGASLVSSLGARASVLATSGRDSRA
jgi:hypothetical protein